MDDFFDILRTVYFFKDLTDDDIRFIGQYCHLESHAAQIPVFQENDAADKFYVVKSGSIEVWKNYGKADGVLLAINGAGHIFGEMALVDDLDRSATIVTHERSEFVVFLHEDFEHILEQRPKVTLSILRSLSYMVRNSNDVFIQNLGDQNKQLTIAYQELKEAQDELLRSERFGNLGKFASFILHDLRNPIAMIKGYAEMITLESENSSVLEFSRKIIHEADHVNRFANEILDYSRGEIRLNYVLTTVDNLFSKAKSYLFEAFARKQINLVFQNECQIPVVIDEERILRVLINTADNARKASHSNGTVSISARRINADLVLMVSDDGDGMSEEVKLRVFEPFYSSSKNGGTGLGMLIVKNVVEAHQGHISIESEPDHGTCITMAIPLQPDSL